MGGITPSFLFWFTQSNSSICTSTPSGSLFSPGIALLHTNVPELPPSSICFHSMCMMKFSYCFSDRITPIGKPLQTSSSPSKYHVSLSVFTLNHFKGVSSGCLSLTKDSNPLDFPNSNKYSCPETGA